MGGSEQFRNRLFDLQNTETVGERGDPIGDEHATGIWRAPTPRRQLITDESVAWASSLPVKRSGPLLLGYLIIIFPIVREKYNKRALVTIFVLYDYPSNLTLARVIG